MQPVTRKSKMIEDDANGEREREREICDNTIHGFLPCVNTRHLYVGFLMSFYEGTVCTTARDIAKRLESSVLRCP